MPGTHAILSPSSSERWINCPPSAKENAGGDTGSSYAQQGSEAHLMAEWKVKKALGHKVRDPTPDLEFYDEEMEECATAYCEFIMEQVQAAKESCPDPLVLVEQRLDFTRWVAESFGTADCIIVADGTMTVIDFKYGLGVLVDAEGNSQMRMYALGTLNLFESLYDIQTVRMIIQRRSAESLKACSRRSADTFRRFTPLMIRSRWYARRKHSTIRNRNGTARSRATASSRERSSFAAWARMTSPTCRRN